MKRINLKQLGCLLLATALLIGMGGCGNNHPQHHSGESKFEVDGVQYVAVWQECTNRQGQIASSFLRLYCLNSDQLDGPDNRGIVSTTYDWSQNKAVWTWRFSGGEDIIAKTETLYFVQNKKIIFEKEYQELGLDASRFDARLGQAAHDYLRPILEKMIRENVPLKENDERSTPTQDDPNEE